MSAQNKTASAAAKVRELSAEELSKKLRDNREELLNLNLRKHTGQVQNPARIRALRRENARILTVMGEKAASKN
ncbi:MAG: 50S ribosomal protein L29 [Opitutae bacterium]|nr:50S ribosomal protein L29 [Opitutae bacterium]MCD8298414.1 50S ribosomal protein L29 [Opitutae bacterium]